MKHFIVILSLKVKPETIGEDLLRQHHAIFREGYDLGLFLLYGPQVPPSGGDLVIARFESHQALATFLERDPLLAEDLATFEAIEFQPTGFPDLLKGWVDPLRFHNPFGFEGDERVST